ncbi:MAG: tRNA (adenosine(37)-N6)-dimethylallyltransferase MiaA [Ignavibacteriales bacterium]|nr:tRNA (adenosine(37)-N6)-dimethylallyltransferase MiaA [Ignavibacteriales bacterium]
MENLVLALVGPTASGKTALSIELAARMNAEIVSADSRQVYRFLDIGTAKPSLDQSQAIPHHFIDVVNPDEEYSAGVYGIAARTAISEIIHRGKLPILVGGSGLYIKSVIDGLFDSSGRHKNVRRRLEERLASEGEDVLREELRRIDPTSAEAIERGKPRRIIRAIEVFEKTGKTISQHFVEQSTPLPHHIVQVGLNIKRSMLYERINERVLHMIRLGLIDEVRSLQAKGYDESLNSLHTVGYRETFEFLRGELSLDGMTAKIQQKTRNFAKRQMTWFRSDKRIHWIDCSETESVGELASRVQSILSRG